MAGLTVVDHPLVQHKLNLMRRESTPTALFRQLLREIAMLLAYEVTRELELETETIRTPMEAMSAKALAGKKPALISILRAGNGLLDGVLELMPTARVGFIGLYRDEERLRPVEYYFKVPSDLANRQVIVLDPMLATGHSASAAITRIKQEGARNIIFLCLVSAPEGVSVMHENHPDVTVVTAALDRCLNENGYIMPGLGDAGDRMFGTR